jgi:hypothetical protein
MQRGYVGFPFPTGKQANALGSGLTTAPSFGTMKPNIVVFDTSPGTRSWTVPPGVTKIRAAAIGAGGYLTGGTAGCGGYSEKIMSVTPGQVLSYTVGAGGTSGTPIGGTSSFAGIISATGGAAGIAGAAAGGVGSGGDVNTSGSPGVTTGGAGSSGHRFGSGPAPTGASGGCGWIGNGISNTGGSAGVDGFGLGLVPGTGGATGVPGGYGAGGGVGASGGIGGGAGLSGANNGTGAVSANATSGGAGGVIVEILQ